MRKARHSVLAQCEPIHVPGTGFCQSQVRKFVFFDIWHVDIVEDSDLETYIAESSTSSKSEERTAMGDWEKKIFWPDLCNFGSRAN